MAADEMLVDTLVDRVSYALVNSSTPDANLDLEIRWALNEVLLDLVTRSDHWGLRMDGSVTLTSGVMDYALADDFHSLIDSSVVYTTNDRRQIQYIPETDFNDFWLQQGNQTGRPYRYFVRAKSQSTGVAQIRFWPTPTQDDTVAYRYRSMPTQVYQTVRGSGEVIDRRFPMEHIPTLIHGSVMHFPQFITDSDMRVHQMKYEQGMAKMRNKASPVEGQAFQRKAYTGGRSGGFGFGSPQITGL